MKITEDYTFPEGSKKNQPCKDLWWYRYCLKIWNIQ